jgi:hypothetical protein
VDVKRGYRLKNWSERIYRVEEAVRDSEEFRSEV